MSVPHPEADPASPHEPDPAPHDAGLHLVPAVAHDGASGRADAPTRGAAGRAADVLVAVLGTRPAAAASALLALLAVLVLVLARLREAGPAAPSVGLLVLAGVQLPFLAVETALAAHHAPRHSRRVGAASARLSAALDDARAAVAEAARHRAAVSAGQARAAAYLHGAAHTVAALPAHVAAASHAFLDGYRMNAEPDDADLFHDLPVPAMPALADPSAFVRAGLVPEVFTVVLPAGDLDGELMELLAPASDDDLSAAPGEHASSGRVLGPTAPSVLASVVPGREASGSAAEWDAARAAQQPAHPALLHRTGGDWT